MLNYFAPKTRHVKLSDSVGNHQTSRGGSFIVSLLNDQYGSHFFWAYISFDPDTRTYSCGLYNNIKNGVSVNNIKENNVSFKKCGFKTEQKAAYSLDEYAAKLATRLLKSELTKLNAKRKKIESLIRYYKTSSKKESDKT